MKRKTLALTIVSSCALIFSSCGGKTPVKKYNIIFQNDDGRVLQESKVKKGELPVYEGADPTKTSTAQYSYTWNGWDPEIAPASQDQTYIAKYEAHVRSYTIRFVNEDGTELDSQVLEYGATPVYAGQVPEKASTAQYSYTFGGWNPAISSVVGDTTYTATYQEVLRSYSITFKNGDGSNLEVKDVAYGQVPATALTPTKESTVDKDFTFDHWDPTPVAVTGEAEYTPVFTETTRQYHITFMNGDDTVLEEGDFDYGTMPTVSQEPTKPSTAQYYYVFENWEPELAAVSGDQVYRPTFGQHTQDYEIFFVDEDGTQLKQDYVVYGQVPVAPDDPTKASDDEFNYQFAGWDPEITAVTGRATYTAKYNALRHAYKFDAESKDSTADAYVYSVTSDSDRSNYGTAWACLITLSETQLRFKTYGTDLYRLGMPTNRFTYRMEFYADVEFSHWSGGTAEFRLEEGGSAITIDSNGGSNGKLLAVYNAEANSIQVVLTRGDEAISTVINDVDVINGVKNIPVYYQSTGSGDTYFTIKNPVLGDTHSHHIYGDWIIDDAADYGHNGSKHTNCLIDGCTAQGQQEVIPALVYEFSWLQRNKDASSTALQFNTTAIKDIYHAGSYTPESLSVIQYKAAGATSFVDLQVKSNDMFTLGSAGYLDVNAGWLSRACGGGFEGYAFFNDGDMIRINGKFVCTAEGYTDYAFTVKTSTFICKEENGSKNWYDCLSMSSLNTGTASWWKGNGIQMFINETGATILKEGGGSWVGEWRPYYANSVTVERGSDSYDICKANDGWFCLQHTSEQILQLSFNQSIDLTSIGGAIQDGDIVRVEGLFINHTTNEKVYVTMMGHGAQFNCDGDAWTLTQI